MFIFFNKAYASPRYIKLALKQELKQKSLKGVLNLARGFLSVKSMPVKITAEMTVLQVEPTLNCNLHCQICERRQFLPRAFLKFEQFRQIIDQLPYLRQVNLTGRGESFLNKDIFNMIAYAATRNIYTRITTNGTLLNEKNCEKIISSGLNELRVSIDSADAEKYRKIKSNVNLEFVKENICRLNKLRGRNRNKPTMEINTILFRENIDDLEGLIKFAHNLEMDAIFASGLVLKDNALAHKENLLETIQSRHLKEKYNKAQKLSMRLGIPLRLPNYAASSTGCFMPWLYFYVTYDGYVLPCCMATRIPEKENKMAEYAMGNIFEQPWAEIKNSAKFRGFRKLLKEHKVPRLCAGCNILNGTF